MAVVTVHQIKKTLGKALRYITRPEATEQGRLVVTNAAVIDPSDWKALTAQYEASHAQQVGRGRKGTVLAHHIIQSFDHDEASPELAQKIGIALAERITGGRFEYTIATQTDTDNVHNHIIINSVSFEDGHKLRVQKSSLGRWRQWSDELCIQNQLSVIQPRESRSHISRESLHATARGLTGEALVKIAIDRACGMASSWAEFESELGREGVTVGRSRKHFVTYQGEGMKYAKRDFKLGVGYTEQDVMARLGRSEVLRFDAHQLLVSEVRGANITLKLPGSEGARFIMVSPHQIVRHGEVLRVYLPAHGTQAIVNREGQITARVPTAALYAAFAPPARRMMHLGESAASANLRMSRRLKGQLNAMHTTEKRLEVRTRYGIVRADQAVVQAVQLSSQADVLGRTIQRLVVARHELPEGSRERAELGVQLSSTQREAESLAASVEALMSWAMEKDGLSERVFENLTLAERLAHVAQRDVQAVRPQARTAAARDAAAQDTQELPDFSTMSMTERAQWARKQAEVQQRRAAEQAAQKIRKNTTREDNER